MSEPTVTKPKGQSDHRSRLYERYVTQHLHSDVENLRQSLTAPQPYLERLIREHLPEDRDAKIVDLGCGYGLLLHVLRSKGYRNLAGIETSAEQVAAAQQLGVTCVRQGDLVETLSNAAPGSFDVIFAFDVIEHFTKDEVLNIFQHVQRSLKTNGTFVLHVPNGEAIFPGRIFFGDFTHQVAFTVRSMQQIAAYAGFDEVRCYEDKPVVHGPISAVRGFLWWAARTGYRFLNMVETGDTGRELILTQNLLAVLQKTK